MRLKHYTNSYDSALSIIKSKQLWMGKVGVAKDSNEILHYLKIFNNIHIVNDIKGLLRKTNPNSKDSMYVYLMSCIAQSYYYKINQLQLGNVFGDVIRDESYILCFTEDDDSTFHEHEYGPVSFVFSENPLDVNKYSEFEFLEKRIQYIDTQEFDLLETAISNFYEKTVYRFESFDSNEHLYNLIASLRKSIKENLNKKQQKALRKEFERDSKQLFDFTESFIIHFNDILNRFLNDSNSDILEKKSIGNYLEEKINKERENKILSFDDPGSARIHKRNGTFKHNNSKDHLHNLISCFLKDIEFENDNEVRVIALPNSSYQNSDGNILKVDLRMEKLVKVEVSKSLENREEILEGIKNELSKKNLHQVEVE